MADGLVKWLSIHQAEYIYNILRSTLHISPVVPLTHMVGWAKDGRFPLKNGSNHILCVSAFNGLWRVRALSIVCTLPVLGGGACTDRFFNKLIINHMQNRNVYAPPLKSRGVHI